MNFRVGSGEDVRDRLSVLLQVDNARQVFATFVRLEIMSMAHFISQYEGAVCKKA